MSSDPGSSPASLGFGLFLFSLILLAGCQGESETPGATSSTLTVLDPNFEAVFNPSWSMWARFLIYDPLVGLGEDGEIEPRLARSWEHSPDGREWTFHLRSDVRWHDGERFDAGDVAFTLRTMSHPEVAYRPRPDTVIVVDDSTVTIRRSRPWSVREEWWWVCYPEHLLEDVPPAEFFDADFWTRPVGTGPFRYVRHEPRTVFELEANEDYFRGEPKLDGLRLKFGGGEPLVELRAGNVELATYVSRAQVPLVRRDPELRVHTFVVPALTSLRALYLNHRHPFLGEEGVRRAVAMAIDRRELRDLLYMPEDLPLFDALFSGRQFWKKDLPPPIRHDPAGARALLDSLGWRLQGEGIRARGEHQARFTLLVSGGGIGGTEAWSQSAVYIQDALREVGIRAEIQGLESGVIRRVRSGEFDAALAGLNKYEEPVQNWGPDSPYGYHSPRLHRIFTALDTTYQATARDSLYRESWPILLRDVPVIFLGPSVQTFAAHRRVRGLEGRFGAHPYLSAEGLWIADEGS